ncbi:hypothetical protein L873DRAFT_771280 [Choiromyces venosus 120613-1]|uniref:Uncharacterized protein n=1 Tax=Choiromyces venosus 120613-1 TaxID=1336337 RepID=A0A3N4JQP6_9PEZI|nr:hypothetical protein L873DRAFT_771280 [Choiromyces venosus 120613-1]
MTCATHPGEKEKTKLGIPLICFALFCACLFFFLPLFLFSFPPLHLPSSHLIIVSDTLNKLYS